MDHSIHILNLEECGSCESGWTMYIASSIHDDHEDAEGCSYGGDTHQITKYDDGDVSDDSMASDASSGPSHPQQIPDDLEGSHQVDYLDDHINPCKKPKIIDKKRGGDGIINVKDVDLVKEAPCRAAAQMDEGERNQKRGEIGDVL